MYAVVHVAETIKGGIATYLLDLLPLQVRDLGPGRVALIVPSVQAHLIRCEGVDVYAVPSFKRRAMRGFSLLMGLGKIGFGCRSEVVHLHSTFSGFFCRLPLVLFSNCRVVYCAHGWAWDRSERPLIRTLIASIERFFSRFSLIVCISRHDFRSAVDFGFPLDRLLLVENGVDIWSRDLGRMRPRANGPLVAGFLGRHDRQKGLDIFLESIALCGSRVRGVVAGDTVLADSSDNPETSNIEFLGWLDREAIDNFFANIDILVVPSRWEGFGLVVLEAYRASVPVLCSGAGGLCDLVSNGETGFIVPANAAHHYSDILLNLSAEECARLGVAGRNALELNYSVDRVHSQLLGAYGFGG